MTATFAQSPWPQPEPAAPAAAAWRFAQTLPTPGGVVLQWVLKRNCSLSPRQLMAVYASLCLTSLLIASAFWAHGARWVAPFAGLELLAVGAALLAYARHAGDRETLTLQHGRLSVEHQWGRRVQRVQFRADRVRVEPQHGDESLVEISGQGQKVHVGRYLRPQWRRALAQELRRALRERGDSRHDSIEN